ncbi:MAG TPA: EF-P lysine aminoacylase GenX [Thiotrichaceae bacterium]|jgi:lysyl-tRNA synthetase class 2|nr:EF-P lysine aminoacylase GenX [Thiotrichaceae bacterium]HIM06942.1 EF-P lysine aminoacylase GenX [Gammaproteobacteria bacterium]
MTSELSWRPTASLELIKQRASLLQQIRSFMMRRHILEVDTPVLSHYANSDPYVESMLTNNLAHKEVPLYLHTSPEFCMKRLLAAELGSIYQITHVFRDEDSGKRHNAEFSMLEWYRLEFDYYQLMDELAELLLDIGLPKPDKMSYAEVFLESLRIDPHTATLNQLQDIGGEYGWGSDSEDRHALLDYIFSEAVIKKINNECQPLIIYDYPQCMAALATIKPEPPYIAERFELFIGGVEIANGFNELCDANEQQQRFETELKTRKDKGLLEFPIDINFLAALESGLPKTAGIAVGIDRLLMVLSGKDDIKEVITFTLDNN